MKTKVIYTDNPPFNQKGEVETKETPKAGKDELYGGNPLVYSDALEQMKNVRKLLKDRLKPVKDNGEAIEDATATEKVRLQGSKESKIPSLKPYTEAVDVKDRASLSKLVEKAKKEKKLFKIGRSMKEGFRYTFLIEEMVKEEAKPEFKVGNTVKIISMAGEPEYTGKVGKITKIDDAGQLHGTWGGLALIPGDDKFELVTVINHDTGKVEEKKEVKEAFFFGEPKGTEITSFEQSQELGKGAFWPIVSDKKYLDMYINKGYKLYISGSGKDRVLTLTKDGEIVNAYDVNDKVVALENLMKSMPKMEGVLEEQDISKLGKEIEFYEELEKFCVDTSWCETLTKEKFETRQSIYDERFFVKDSKIYADAPWLTTTDKFGNVKNIIDRQDIEKRRLPLIEEGGEEHKDEGEYDEEGDMAKSDLQIMADAALELHGMLADEENLPEWVQAKITLATDYIDTARDYMKAKKDGKDFPEPKEDEEMIKEDASPSLGKRTGVITVAEYKGFLNDALEVVADADDTEKVRLASSTYNMDLPYIGTYGGYIAINSPISGDQSEDEEEELEEAKKPLGESSTGSWGKEVITLQEFATAVEKLGRDDIDVFPILKGIAAGTHRAFVKHEGKDTTITVLRGDVVEMTLTSKKEEALVESKGRKEYCVMDSFGNNIDCFSTEEEAKAFAETDLDAQSIKEVIYAEKDENKDEAELSAETVWERGLDEALVEPKGLKRQPKNKQMKESNGPKGELYERVVFHFIGDFGPEHFYDLDNDTIGITPIPGNAKYDATLWTTRDGSYALAMFKDGEELNTDELDYFDTAEEAALYALDTDNYDALEGNDGDGGLDENIKKNSKKEKEVKKLKEGKQPLNEMLIDLILERKDGFKYNPETFYRDAMQYSGTFDGIADAITRAMDEGTEEDVKKALCKYVLDNDYNPEICDYINSVTWLEADLDEALVEPKPGEKEADYVSRFMGTKLASKDFPNQKQRLAVAYGKFNASKGKKEDMEIKETKFFPGEDGDTEAHIFIEDKGIEDFDLIWDDKKGGYVLTWESKEEMEEMKEYVTEEKHGKEEKKDLKESFDYDGFCPQCASEFSLSDLKQGKKNKNLEKCPECGHEAPYEVFINSDFEEQENQDIDEAKKPEGKKEVISTTLTDEGVLKIFLGNSILAEIEDGKNTESFIKDTLHGMGYIWNKDGTVSKKKEEGKKPLEEKKLKEDTTILSSLNEFKPWSGAVSTWDLIVEADKVDALDFMLEDLYPEGITSTELNDLLWFESGWILDVLKISGTVSKEKSETEEETKEEETEEGKEDFMSALNDIEDEPVVNVTGNELEEAKHAHHKKENQEETQEVKEEVKESTGNVFKEVQDFIAKTVSK